MHAVGQVLQKVHGNIKANNESQVLIREHLLQKAAGNYLFFRQGAVHTVTAVNEQADGKRLVRQRGKILDGLRLALFQQLEMIFFQIGDEGAVLVFYIKQHVDHGHVFAEDRYLALLIDRFLIVGRLVFGRLLRGGLLGGGSLWSSLLRMAASHRQKEKCERNWKK